ncbi:MAG: dipeptide ABC transporter ATP-binding protein [Alphaproteobacteria bacterium]|nr:dipeptide ABC transporter ATP-binding protein [Alphaproteobacteria bacterium]
MSAAAPPPVLAVEGLRKHFPIERGLLRRATAHVRAVDDVSFAIERGTTLCLVGESGCGKSTVGKLILRFLQPTAGRVTLGGVDVTRLDEQAMRGYRRHVQMVFQDPYASLNPRLTAGTIVGEPLENFGGMAAGERADRVAAVLARVGLRADAMRKFPFEFSGGQRQRLGIARALVVSPSVIVADEPVSALDVSVQAQVLNLMADLQDELKLAYLFISHDLGVVEHIGHRVAVMYLGRLVEMAEKEALFAAPLHPYTQALIDAAPLPDPHARRRRLVIEGDVPSPIDPPPGCRFHTRCPFAVSRCRTEEPALRETAPGRLVACHLREDGSMAPLAG